ncbi:hypothetical protein, partial [Klebsiella aerogenes]|uniref:hypothetical protein n=1 Tax=Klebsiella aerogenes TaxID=548 RepID=UPI003A84247A
MQHSYYKSGCDWFNLYTNQFHLSCPEGISIINLIWITKSLFFNGNNDAICDIKGCGIYINK